MKLDIEYIKSLNLKESLPITKNINTFDKEEIYELIQKIVFLCCMFSKEKWVINFNYRYQEILQKCFPTINFLRFNDGTIHFDFLA